MRSVRLTVLSGALVLAWAGAAFAQSGIALVTRDLNFRAQPTVHSHSFGVIPGGTTIPAGPCGQGWCLTQLGGQTGYVSQQYLDFGGPPRYGPGVYVPAPPPVVYGPPPPPPPPPPYWGWGWRRW